MQGWFVVQTNPQREQFAADNLTEFTPYCPRFKARSGRVKALFPSYLFVVATPDWPLVKNSWGVRSLLMVGERPAIVADQVIASWKAQESSGLVQLPDPPRFHQGERLVVMRGTLKYKIVIHTGMSAKEREHVLIDMLGAMVQLSIPGDDLVPEKHLHTRNSLRHAPETPYAATAKGKIRRSI